MLRKVIEAPDEGEIEVWGDGNQTRSFLYVRDCVDAVLALMGSEFPGPVNIGSEELVSINQLAAMAIELSGKKSPNQESSRPRFFQQIWIFLSFGGNGAKFRQSAF